LLRSGAGAAEAVPAVIGSATGPGVLRILLVHGRIGAVRILRLRRRGVLAGGFTETAPAIIIAASRQGIGFRRRRLASKSLSAARVPSGVTERPFRSARASCGRLHLRA